MKFLNGNNFHGLFRKLKAVQRLPRRFYLNRWWLKWFPIPPIEVLADEWAEVFNRGAGSKLLYIALKYDYGDRSRGLGYEEHNFLHCLQHMADIEVVRLDVCALEMCYGRETANAVLKEVALREQVDKLIILHYHDVYDHDLLRTLRDECQIFTIIWLFDDDKRFDETRELVQCFSRAVTTIKVRHEARLKQGFDSVLCQFAANQYLYNDMKLKRDIDVVFIGQNFGNRQQYIDFLLKNGIRVKCFGLGWSSGRISQSEMIEALNRSKIALNFSSSAGHLHLKFLKGRVFEIPATGAMLLTEVCEQLDEYLEIGKEVEVFSNQTELLSILQRYLANPSEIVRLANAGKKRVLADYTLEKYLRLSLQ